MREEPGLANGSGRARGVIGARELPAAERVRAELERQIVAGRLAPGLRLDEAELAARFAVSRTPVREALRALAAQSLVELRAHAGAFIPDTSPRRLMEILEALTEVEATCSRLAAARAGAADLAAIRPLQAACLRAALRDDRNAYFAADRAFHDAIGEASHNACLADLAAGLRRQLDPWRRQVVWRTGIADQWACQHAPLFAAIEAGSPDDAAAAARHHLEAIRRDAFELLEALPAPA